MDSLEILGKVSDYVGKKGKIGLTDTNFAGTARVMINLYNEKGKKMECLLSSQLSAQLRDNKIKLGHLLSLDYAEGKDEVKYIIRPKGNEKTFDVSELTKEDYATETVINIEDYISLLADKSSRVEIMCTKAEH